MPNVHNPTKDWIAHNKYIIFPVLAFVIPLAVRTIPEILMDPYILGFDTMAFYVPNTLLWLHNGINLWSFLAVAPLLYAIFMSTVAVGGSLVFVLKILSPLFLGFLGLSIYTYAKKGLGWSPNKSTFVALLGTLYFVALRTSWDQLREELGLVFFFVALTLLMLLINRKDSSWKRYVVLSFAMMAVVLSHQLISVLMFGVIIVTVAYNLFRKDFKWSINLVVVSLPSALYFVIIYLSGLVPSGYLGGLTIVVSPLASLTGFASYQSMLISEGGFFLYCFLPLLPLVVIGLWRFRNLQLRSWLLLSFILLFIPLSSVSPFRWILLLTYPLAFCATEALSRLKPIKWKRFKFTVHRIAILYLILSTAILSFGFIFTTPENPFFYFSDHFNSYVYEIPTSMLQNTVSITDCHDTVNALQWFKDNFNSSAVLLTHSAFYGWALLTLNNSQIIYYGFGDPVNAATTAAQEGHTQIYLIWWINGQGWYGQPNVSPSFQEVYHSGKIAIYSYAPS
ncbi:MAG: hypothetical protein ABSD92_01245 [Candidatus Bathyarchaeia archaeon]